MKCLIYGSLIIVLGGVILGVSFRDDLFAAYLYTLEGLAILVPITVILAVVALGFYLAKRRVWKGLIYSLVITSSCVISLIFFMESGSLINGWKVDAVEHYVASAVPILDGMKQKDGMYPSKLPIGLLGEPPEFLRLYGDYSSTGSTFRFEFIDEPAGWAGGSGYIEFNSTTRKWDYER